LFTALQGFEYVTAPFTISDGMFGSTFYMATGFHGFHVLVGTIFLTVCLIRLLLNQFSVQHHFGFEAAAFY
jgi:cytochrome c oxidase subunit 3